MNFLEKLRAISVKRCEEVYKQPVDSWSPSDWACAMGGECGEALNFVKKMRRGDTDVTVKHVADELADVVIYADLLAARLGINLEEAIVSKFNEVTDRMHYKNNGTFEKEDYYL